MQIFFTEMASQENDGDKIFEELIKIESEIQTAENDWSWWKTYKARQIWHIVAASENMKLIKYKK